MRRAAPVMGRLAIRDLPFLGAFVPGGEIKPPAKPLATKLLFWRKDRAR